MYRLCKKLSLAGIADREASDLYVVFISNDKKQVCLLTAQCISYCSFHCHKYLADFFINFRTAYYMM